MIADVSPGDAGTQGALDDAFLFTKLVCRSNDVVRESVQPRRNCSLCIRYFRTLGLSFKRTLAAVPEKYLLYYAIKSLLNILLAEYHSIGHHVDHSRG